MRARKKSHGGTIRDAKDALVRLQSNIFLPAMREEAVRGYFANFVRYAALQDLQRKLPGLIERPKILASICPLRRNLAGIISNTRIRTEDFRMKEIYNATFGAYRGILDEFFSQSEKFEVDLLYGNYDQALLTLDSIFELTGYSFWLIRSRILVLARAGRLEEMNEYCQECRRMSNDNFSPFLFNCFVFLATNPLLHYRRVIQSSIDELSVNGPNQWSDLLALMLSPSPIARAPQQLICFSLLQSLPLVDQALLMEQLGSNNYARNSANDELSSVFGYVRSFRLRDGSRNELDQLAAKYEAEDYIAVMDAIAQPNGLSPRQIVQSANLVAKSISIIGQQRGDNLRGTVKDLVLSLGGLYSLDPSPRRHVDSIKAVAMQMQHLSFGPSLTLLLYQVLPNQCEPEERKFAASRAQALEITPSLWLLRLAGQDDPLVSHDYQLANSQIPSHRQLKRRIRSLCRESDLHGVLSELDRYRDASPLARDYYEIASSVLVQLGDLNGLVKICGAALADSQSAYSAFPLKQLVDYVEENEIADVDGLLVVNAYVRNVSTAKEYLLNETFEAFLALNGVQAPSQLAERQVSLEKMNVVLRDICSVDNLDFLSIYESSNDVRAERIRILDQLLSRGGIRADRHRDEVEGILLQSLVDGAATEMSMQKIDVNDQELKRLLIDDVTSLFHLYRSSADSSERDFIKIESSDENETEKAAVVGDRNTTLQKIYQIVRNAFLFDEKHGLDKNLSAEIRHGFFSNLMRSKLDARMLLTEKGEDGEYKQNAYWREVNGILVDEALDDLDGHLKWFTAEFNLVLARAEEWMKVTTSPDTDRVFSYGIYRDLFVQLRAFSDATDDPSKLLDHIVDLLWNMTEAALTKVRELLDGTLRDDIERLFDELIRRIEAVRGGAPLADLHAAIRMARNEVREDISVVKEWFKRGEPLSGRARTLRDLVAISIECYSRVRRIDVQLEFDRSEGLIGISLQGKESKSLVVSLMNLYENAISHSGYGTQTRVNLRARVLESAGWELVVSNPVTPAVQGRLMEGALESVQRKIIDPSSASLVHTEGGTGLGKVINQLGDVGEQCSLDISMEGCDFVASIRYDT